MIYGVFKCRSYLRANLGLVLTDKGIYTDRLDSIRMSARDIVPVTTDASSLIARLALMGDANLGTYKYFEHTMKMSLILSRLYHSTECRPTINKIDKYYLDLCIDFVGNGQYIIRDENWFRTADGKLKFTIPYMYGVRLLNLTNDERHAEMLSLLNVCDFIITNANIDGLSDSSMFGGFIV